jgi:hypothetical protein
MMRPLAAFISFSESVIGHSHLKKQKPCQDSSLCVIEKDYLLIAVADGHGGDQYFRSDRGSEFAVETVKECMANADFRKRLEETIENKNKQHDKALEKEQNALIYQLKSSILSNWSKRAHNDFCSDPFNDAELEAVPEKYVEKYKKGEKIESAYGSTLIAALLTTRYLLVMQIGDGNCVVVEKDLKFKFLAELIDKKCFLNTTTSLCDGDALGAFHHVLILNKDEMPNLPAAVFIGTDGVDDSLGNEEGLYSFYRTILKGFSEKDTETAKNELFAYLPRLSEKGSGDDVSVAAIIDKEWLEAQKFDVPPDSNQPKAAPVQETVEPEGANLQDLLLDRNNITPEDQRRYETEKLAGKVEPMAGGQEMAHAPAQEAQAEQAANQNENAGANGITESKKNEDEPGQ